MAKKPPPDDHVLRLGMDRRRFMLRAAALGLTAAAFPAFLAACAQLDAEDALPLATPPDTPFPTPTQFTSAAVSPRPAATAIPQPSATAPAPPPAPAFLASTTTPTRTPAPITQPATATPAPTPTVQPATATPAPTVPTPTGTPAPTQGPTPQPATATHAPSPTQVPPAETPTPPSPLTSERARISHLVWRAGFGASPAEIVRFRAMGLQATIDHLVDFDAVDDSALETRLASQELDLEKLNHLQRWWLQRMAFSARPLQEKMALFWHGILTSSYRKVGKGPQMLAQNRLFRSEGMGRYDALLKSISRDPAMMIYLDSRSNKKAAPNENYSRELMELFSLGIGHFTEKDVRESARAFTGWQLKAKTEFIFNRGQHDYGIKTFLGRTGRFDGDDIVDIIMAQPAAAEYVCTRLWSFFAYPDPEPAVVSRLAAIFRENNTEIRPVVRAIFQADEFYSDRAVAALVKGPVELAVGTVRTLGIDTDFKRFDQPIEGMGQVLFDPPNVAGWPGGAAWLNSSALLQRINLANTVATARSGPMRFNPAALLAGQDLNDLNAVVGSLGELLLGGRLRQPELRLLSAFLESMNNPANGLDGEPPAEKLRSLVYLLLASPDYQLV